MAAGFTVGELSALRVILDEVRDRGRCLLAIAIIAARAAVSRSTVKRALKAAKAAGLISVTERRSNQYGVASETNVVVVISPELASWMHRGGGVQKRYPTDIRFSEASTRTGGVVSGDSRADAPGRREAISRGKKVALR
jgi:DNA-binding Lrp family transcriptional regulator